MAHTRKEFLQKTMLAAFSSVGFGSYVTLGLLPDLSSSNKIKPKALKKGDTIGLVAPASPIYDKPVYKQMLIDLKELGFNLKKGKHVKDQWGYLAGADKDRAHDLMNMFEDPEVDGIICIRGGWGSNRILPLLDFELINTHPKVFCGFSDITSLHMALYQKSNLITFHGPVGKSVWTDFTTQSFTDIIQKGKKATFGIPGDHPEDNDDNYTIHSGEAKGILLGGNLSVLTSMIGSDYLPSFKGAILFLEDVGESVYRVDRMLTQLKMAGILNEINGFVFGKCTECAAGDNSLTLKELLNDHIKPLGIPAYYGAMISHEEDNITLPVGVPAEINSTQKTIRILESAVV